MSECRETLARILTHASEEAGGWRQLAAKLGLTTNAVWRHSHPEGTDGTGGKYANTLPNGAALERIMVGLNLTFTSAPGHSTMADVADAIVRLEIDSHTRDCMIACVHALYVERERGSDVEA